MMAEAICIRCGSQKQLPWKKCARCGFAPSGDDEALVKSVYLSLGRFTDVSCKEAYRAELDRIGLALEQGEPPIFLDAELSRLREQKELLKSIPPSAVWGAVLRLFLPAGGFLLLLFALAHLLRMLR